MSVPGIWLHCANNSLATPQNRFLNPYLVRCGWEPYLSPVLYLVRRFRVPAMFLVLPLGDECREWRDGTCPTRQELRDHGSILRRQSFHAYRDCVARGIGGPWMDMDAMRRMLRLFRDEGCFVVPYIGPWLRGVLNDANVRSELEWLFDDDGCVVTHICEDGSGSRISTMRDRLAASGIGYVEEPMSQRTTNDGKARDPIGLAVPSITLEQSLRDMSGYYPLDQYTGTRYWVDNVNYGNTDAWWRLARERAGQGFVPCIEPRADVFAVWDEMIVANPS